MNRKSKTGRRSGISGQALLIGAFTALCFPAISGGVDPSSAENPAAADTACALSEPEARLATLLTGDRQKRPVLRCRLDLQRFARLRAEDMARRGYLSHLTPDREGPNHLLRTAGYPLPPSYRGGLSNNVESIAGGIRSPEAVWDALTASSSHRAHLLGEHPAYREQDEFGVAYARDLYAPHVDYWVVIIARRTRAGEDELICTPEPAECFRIAEDARPAP